MIILRLSPDFSTAMSAGSMVGSLGATLCGVTFPLFAMEAPVRWAAAVFPIRWFMSLWSSAYVL
jgi:ABC-2 type transport system permease protein